MLRTLTFKNLVMAVIRPGGTLATYFNQQCSGSANMNVTFDAQGSAFACGSPTTGTYIAPSLDLNIFNGFSQQGNWQFGFKDAVAGNTGSINSIALEVCSSAFVLLANSNFEFENFSLYPNPNDSNFTVQFNSNQTGKIGIMVHDMSGKKNLRQELQQYRIVQSGIALRQCSGRNLYGVDYRWRQKNGETYCNQIILSTFIKKRVISNILFFLFNMECYRYYFI